MIERSIAHTFTDAHKSKLILKSEVYKLSFLEQITKVCITEDSKYIVTAGKERHVKVWDKAERTMIFEFKNVHFGNKDLLELCLYDNNNIIAELTAMACTHNSKYIISGSRGLNIYDFETLKIVYQVKDFHKGCFAFFPNRNLNW